MRSSYGRQTQSSTTPSLGSTMMQGAAIGVGAGAGQELARQSISGLFGSRNNYSQPHQSQQSQFQPQYQPFQNIEQQKFRKIQDPVYMNQILRKHKQSLKKCDTSLKLSVKQIIKEYDQELLIKGSLNKSKNTKTYQYTFNDHPVFIILNRDYAIQLMNYDSLPSQSQLKSALSTINDLSKSHGYLLELIRRNTKITKYYKADLQQLTTPVQVMTHIQVRQYSPWKDFAVSAKYDGLHCVVVYIKGNGYIIYNNQFEQVLVSGIVQQTFIIEGERVDNTLHIYDAIIVNDKNITSGTYKQRLEELQKLKNLQIKQLQIQFVNKHFVKDKSDLEQVITNILKYDRTPVDGIIFQSNNTYYDQVIYKWKPLHLCTIDFLVKRVIIKDIPMGQLYVKVSKNVLQNYKFINKEVIEHNNVNHIVFQPTFQNNPDIHLLQADDQLLRQIDGTICEFKFKKQTNGDPAQWILHKQRPDKLTANSYIGADSLYSYIQKPIIPEQLYNPKSLGYFNLESGEHYKDMRKYMNSIKVNLISQYMKGKKVLDLGIGRGQDIMKYSYTGIDELIGIDTDIYALQELTYRKAQVVQVHKGISNIKVYQYDLNNIKDKQLTDIADNADAVCSFFSFHYYQDSTAIDYMLDSLKNDSLFIIIVINSDQILKLLNGNQSYKSKNYEYELQKNTLKIKLPFSSEPYTEDLIDLVKLKQRMSRCRYVLSAIYNCNDLHFQQDSHIKSLYYKCSEEDLIHISLYTVVIFRKYIPNK